MKTPLVSIVVPTCNGMATLPALIDALHRQRFDGPFEIVAVDSSSTDGTEDFLRGRVDRLISIPADTFDHGLTRNLGIENATAELVVLTVQDALPATDTWLAELLGPLRADPTIAGAFARQRPRRDASAVTRHYAERAVAASDVPRTVAIDPAEFAALTPSERLVRCTFDNVCSCIRRSVWRDHPFRQTPMAEDIAWAVETLMAGHRLAFVPTAAVEHSHERSARYEFTRTYLLHQRLFELLRLRTIPNVSSLARSISGSLALHLRCERSAPSNGRQRARFVRAIALAFAWPLGQYLGASAAARRTASTGRS